MARRVSQRELRNRSGEIMRELDRGADFVITRSGVPVGNLIPTRRRAYVDAGAAIAAFAAAPAIDVDRFRADVDQVLDQDPGPRG